ncbi:hypothetical protein [Paenibacillus shenyangensis]|uniref:hypothetical protein n=1 Tax=Paenibacillus sp. A9 TaxID=1284352 RepID=UPI001EE73B9C|nr:hypothetical protein [Paenibacillus sp. A9]
MYPEIELSSGGPRADIVAIQNEQLLIVEMKTSFGLAVMDQAYHWAAGGYAHQTYIAIPRRSHWEVPIIAQRALCSSGIGVLQVELQDNPYRSVEAYRMFEENRVRTHMNAEILGEAQQAQHIINILTPHHLNGPDAGGKAGGHISAHRLTMIRAQEYMEAAGDWVTPKQIVENIETHYFAQDKAASLKQALLQWGTDFCEYQVIGRRGMFRSKQL